MDELSSSWDSDDEYGKFLLTMNPPRVTIDNESCVNATVVSVDSVNKYGILLEVVQVLTDLDLIIKKAYISSDGGWFMDVFNVTNSEGTKITDDITLKEIAEYIRKSLSGSTFPNRVGSIGLLPESNYTSIELTGSDRPGLLSEITAILTDLKVNVVNAEIWTHNTRAAAVMQVTDFQSGSAISDPLRLSKIKQLLTNVLKGRTRVGAVGSREGLGFRERRLHQLMREERDYERERGEERETRVSVVNIGEKDYSVVTVRCKDRAKLLFDTVCTLTDMQYVVFHGSVDTESSQAYQEYYIRHVDGLPVNSEAERERVIQCLEAAIERRVSEGIKLELCTSDKVGLLSEITRIFRENGLSVTRAEVATHGDKAVNTFYVRDSAGCEVNPRILDSIRNELGQSILQVKGQSEITKIPPQESPARFLFGALFKSKSLCSLGLIKS